MHEQSWNRSVCGRSVPSLFACLAYALEDPDDLFEVANVEDRKNKLNVAEVSIAVLQFQTAGLAIIALARNTHAHIEWSIFCVCSTFIEVEHSAVREFHVRLVDHILIRTADNQL
jgi:hypothetical protein